MKYSKAEVEIIVMKNLDIVTSSIMSDIISDAEKTAAYGCSELGINQGWNKNGKCLTINEGFYLDIIEELRKRGLL